jgi:hypothetical protein
MLGSIGAPAGTSRPRFRYFLQRLFKGLVAVRGCLALSHVEASMLTPCLAPIRLPPCTARTGKGEQNGISWYLGCGGGNGAARRLGGGAQLRVDMKCDEHLWSLTTGPYVLDILMPRYEHITR